MLFSVLFRPSERLFDVGNHLFAYSTILGWSYYGERVTLYLFDVAGFPVYRSLYLHGISWRHWRWRHCLTATDISNALMAIPNIIMVLLCTGMVAKKRSITFTMVISMKKTTITHQRLRKECVPKEQGVTLFSAFANPFHLRIVLRLLSMRGEDNPLMMEGLFLFFIVASITAS